MRITDHSFLVASFGQDLNKIKEYLDKEDVVEVVINEHIKVNKANYIANFSTYNFLLTHE